MEPAKRARAIASLFKGFNHNKREIHGRVEDAKIIDLARK